MDKVVLVQNFYMNERRRDEIYFCLEQNIKNKHIDEILLLSQSDVLDSKYLLSGKVQLITGYDRPTFKEMFLFLNQKYTDGEIIILSNLDIFFDKTLHYVKGFNWHDTVMALTRWEFNGSDCAYYLGWDYSQDCWIWKSPMSFEEMYCDFSLGKPGCDNRIAHEFSKKYNVINPCKTIRANHYHLSGYRTYKPGDPTETIPEPHKRVTPMSLRKE